MFSLIDVLELIPRVEQADKNSVAFNNNKTEQSDLFIPAVAF